MPATGLELISSSFGPSLDPKSLTFAAEWKFNGVSAYTSCLATPDEICSDRFWRMAQEQLSQWFLKRPRKSGEIVCPTPT